jgi:hypothetical protein
MELHAMKISFSNNIYMAFGATTINFVTVACSLHLQIICFKLSDGTRHYDHACARLYLMARSMAGYFMSFCYVYTTPACF